MDEGSIGQGRLTTGGTTIVSAFLAHAQAEPDLIVLIDSDGTTWTRADLDRRSGQWAETLRRSGVRVGTHVGLSCDPALDTVAAYLGIMRAGAVVVPANTGYTAREIAHIIDDAAPAFAVVDSQTRAGVWADAGVQVVAPPATDAVAATDDASRAPASALIGYTSGTTGAPKGAVLTHANLMAGAGSVVAAWEWTELDRLLLALPMFHMHGLGVGVNGTLVSGGSAVVLPAFSPDAVLDAVSQRAATMFFGVPTMYARLAQSERVPELRALRVAVSGSAPLPSSVWQRIHEAAGVGILERYGMTETVMLASNPLHGERRAGTVGPPLPGVEIRLGDGDVVEVRGANVFDGYFGRPEATSEAFTDDGWFRTGDIGRFDVDGYLSLVGRASELIISGGYNVYPREVEDVLRAQPDVADVAVVGTADEEWGEIVTAHVVLSESAAAALAATGDDAEWVSGLAVHARAELAAYKVPRRWHRLDALPRNAMGKVVRHLLLPPSTL